MQNKNKKAQLNISFGWIFAIVVGGFILFLAIYGITKFTNINQTQQSAETGKEISVLLNPLETGFESATATTIYAPVETRIYTECEEPEEDSEFFGKQKIWTSQKMGNSWSNTNVSITSRNRYIFSESSMQGKNFIAFSKSFEFPSERRTDFPFKVADLIYMFSADEEFCFVDADEEIEEELDLMQNNSKIKNFYFDECPSGSKKICFNDDEDDCDVLVNYNAGNIEKDSEVIYFETDALMYAGIFSEPSEYECQMKRIFSRAEQLTEIYEKKSDLETSQGCRGDLNFELTLFKSLLNSYNESENVFHVMNEAENLNSKNSAQGGCKLW